MADRVSDPVGRDAAEDDGEPPLERRTHRINEVLAERGTRVTVGVLADAVRRRERDGTAREEESGADARSAGAGSRSREGRGDVHEDLVTRVLPAMESDGTLVFDERRGTVRAVGPLRARVTRLPAALATHTVASTLAVGVLAALAVVPLGGIDPVAMAGAGGTTAFASRLLAWLA